MNDSKPLVWLAGEVKSPPFSPEARVEAGFLLRQLQKGFRLSLPHSRPMLEIGAGCHELRINDRHESWRIIHRLDKDAVVIGEIFSKKTKETPKGVIDICRKRFNDYEWLGKEE